MRIFAGGIETETNLFCPIPTALQDFQVVSGADVRAGRVLHPSLDLRALWGKQAAARGDTLVFGLMAFAQPCGMTVRSAYESLRDALLDELRSALPVDVVLLKMHGAMIADGYEDCEEDILRRVRDIAGPHAIIGVELDLHCHLSESKIACADIVLTYKEYPHVDVNSRAEELFNLAVAAKSGKISPTMALFDCRMVGLYPTTRDPLRGFVDSMIQAERRAGVLSVSFGHGFQYADSPRVGAKMLVVADGSPALAAEVARELGRQVYRLRRQIGFDSISLPMDSALSKASTSRQWPVVVADQSDNAGGGAPADSTYALRWLLDHRITDAAVAIVYDPEVAKIAKKAGRDARLPVRLGGKLGASSGDPLDLEVTVLAVRENYMHEFPQESGEAWMFSVGDVVGLRAGGIDIVVSSERCQCFSPSIFSDLGIDPRCKRILVVKSLQHFHGAFAPMAAEVIYMAAAGALAPDPRRIQYRRLETTRLYPWSEDPLADES